MFNQEEIIRIKEYFSTRSLEQFLLISLLCDTGCRIGEALAITPQDIQFQNKTLSITKSVYKGRLRDYTKNGQERNILIPDCLLPVLSRYSQSSVSLPSSPEVVRIFFNKALKVLGIPQRKIHSLRASYVTHSLRKGLPPLFVASQVGDTLQTILNNYVGKVEAKLTPQEEAVFNQ